MCVCVWGNDVQMCYSTAYDGVTSRRCFCTTVRLCGTCRGSVVGYSTLHGDVPVEGLRPLAGQELRNLLDVLVAAAGQALRVCERAIWAL
jgi:hypothetical protein